MRRFCILGPVRVSVGGEPVPLGAPKQRAVLACLLLHRGAAVPRERLVDAVWGEDAPRAARQSLQVYVHGLRRALGADAIETTGASYRLRVAPGELDLDRFDELVERAAHAEAPERAAADLRAALALWEGPALADLAGSPVAAEGERLADRRLRALEALAAAELAAGRHDATVGELAALVAAHPYRERLRELQILALYRSGRQKDALDAYRAARRTLVDELGIEPGPALRELERAILRQEPTLAAPARAAAARPRLPVPPTPLIGRDAELADVIALVDDGARVVTLTGPGGAGKTRLALGVAAELATRRRDGAAFVDLAAVSDHELVAQAIAEALGVQEDDRPLERAIAEHLRPLEIVLVLDNFEQILPAATLVADLVSAAPDLVLLVTSRAPLRVRAEHDYPVPPLSESEAVRLFVARARAAARSFELTDDAEVSIAHICRALDGLPLAIELAAARMPSLTPAAIAERIGRALDVLVEGPRDLPPRQRTLRATLDWSHAALGDRERALFARLAVFSGGGTERDIEAVCGANGLAALVEVNLLRRRPDGSRYTMLETIREYALERLVERGELDAVRERHCRHFVALAERTNEAARAGDDAEPLYASLHREHDNLRAALEWAADTGETELEVRLASAMRQFWIVQGHLREGQRAFVRAVANTAGGEPALRAAALMNGGPFHYRQGELVQAKAWWEEALELLRAIGDRVGSARCAGELGAVAFSEGDFERAKALYGESAQRFEELGDLMRLAIVSANLAETETMRGDLDAALRHGERAVAIQRDLADRDALPVSLHSLARVRRRRGDDQEARSAFAEGLTKAREIDYWEMAANCVEGAAEFALAGGDAETAARLLVVARRTVEGIGVRLQGVEGEGYAATYAALRDAVGPERLAAIEREAQDTPLEDVVDEALAILAR